MGRRSGIPTNSEDLGSLSPEELETEILRAEQQLSAATISNDRKGYFRRLIWLEAHREAAFGVPAPVRRMRARSDPQDR
jgi:hypothetical protein